MGIHNKQDNWKLPVKKDLTEYKAAGPFYKKKIKVADFHKLVAS